MPARFARGVVTPKNKYICPSCRLQILSPAGGQNPRYQHSGPPANVGGDADQQSVTKYSEKYNQSMPRSRIGDLIRSFMFKPPESDKETKSDLRIESLGKNERLPNVSASTPSTIPQPKDSTDVLQQKLQQKFAAQRRRDIFAMQMSQVPKATIEIKNVPKAPSVSESTKQSSKKSSRAERIEWKRKTKLEEVALRKKSKKRSKKSQAKPTEAAQDEIAEIARPTQPRTAEEPPTSIEASAEKTQATSEADDSDSTGYVSGEQTSIKQKIDDFMDILESSKGLKKPKEAAKVARRLKTSSTDTEIKRVIEATLKKLSEEPLDIKSRKANAMISQYSSQILARLNNNLEKTARSSKQSKDSLVEHSTKNPPPSSSMQLQVRKLVSRQDTRKHPARARKFMSLQAALMQKSGQAKGDLESVQILPSGKSGKVRAPSKKSLEKIQNPKYSSKSPIKIATASDLEILPVAVDQPPVPRLAYGLERVLFNPGVYQLQDPRSRVYNFDPYLQKIMPIAEFDFNALKEYVTSSRDDSLNRIAKEHGKRYMGSTSSMTEVLAHFHFLLSQWRPINSSMLSKDFPADLTSFTEFQRIPSAIFLRWKDGSYAIDADKQFATANVLSMLGKSMEKLLTLNTDDFERYRKSSPGQVTEDERFAPEAYHYSTLGDFLMRSQLDAHDPRLPGTGVFDLKTRSVVSIRMDVANYGHGIGYEIKNRQGKWESYEREYYDLIRAAFLKYSLQVRMGRMDGIFVAFHNIERIFGFQYISLPEMDTALHGQRDTSIGDQEFRLSLDLMNKVLDRATKKYPETSLRIFFETRDTQTPFMYVFAEPVTEEQVAEIQSQNSAKIQEFERSILGLTHGSGPGTDDAQEVDPKWEKIQADVQKAMEKDELSIDEFGQDQEAICRDGQGTEFPPYRPEVVERGPLYARKSAAGVDDDVTAASAENDEDEGDSEDDNDNVINYEDEREDEDEGEEGEEEEEDGDNNEFREAEESRQQEGLGESPESEADINSTDAFKAEHKVDRGGAEGDHVTLGEDHALTVQNDTHLLTEEPNEDETPETTLGQESINETRESENDGGNTRVSPEASPSSIAGEDRQENQTEADQPSINQEGIQADTAEPSSKDVLAMSLTLRNKVNGEYVLRPENMTSSDEWSIEYSLTEVPELSRARTLYTACQRRRRKKMETSMAREDEEEVVSVYIRKLRELSAKGRRWRQQQDNRDREKPAQVL